MRILITSILFLLMPQIIFAGGGQIGGGIVSEQVLLSARDINAIALGQYIGDLNGVHIIQVPSETSELLRTSAYPIEIYGLDGNNLSTSQESLNTHQETNKTKLFTSENVIIIPTKD